MPGPIHEILLFFISQETILRLRAIAQGDSPSAKFAGNIVNSASSKIVFEDTEYGPHEPDASFQHLDAQYPGVILELSYSQKRKDLPRLADAYILGSNANIRVVVGVDIEYKGSKKASISIWRPHIEVDAMGEKELSVVQTVTDKLFRDEKGKLVPDSQASLELQLQDFANEKFVETFPDLTQSIHLFPETLYSLIERAETTARRLQLREGSVNSDTPSTRKRRRDSTPPEQLNQTGKADSQSRSRG